MVRSSSSADTTTAPRIRQNEQLHRRGLVRPSANLTVKRTAPQWQAPSTGFEAFTVISTPCQPSLNASDIFSARSFYSSLNGPPIAAKFRSGPAINPRILYRGVHMRTVRHPITATALVTIAMAGALSLGSVAAQDTAPKPKPYKPITIELPQPVKDPSFAAFRKQMADIAK